LKEGIFQFAGGTLTIGTFSLTFSLSGVVEMIIFSVACYYIIMWIKRTKAWNLLKGAGILMAAYLLARLFRLNNIAHLFESAFSSILIAIIVILQPELRRALEQLGKRNVFQGLLHFGENSGNGLTEASVDAIVRAVTQLGKNKVGALIILERTIELDEYIETGIALNADISSALLEQIFEHNTPLHDGAVIIRDNRIVSATCYLPLSQNTDISKELGTRHRAGLGISEMSDCITIIASEETGYISTAVNGRLNRNITADELRNVLISDVETEMDRSLSTKLRETLKGGRKDEEEN